MGRKAMFALVVVLFLAVLFVGDKFSYSASVPKGSTMDAFMPVSVPTPFPDDDVVIVPLEFRLPDLKMGDCLQIKGEARYYFPISQEAARYGGLMKGQVLVLSSALVYDSTRGIFVLLVSQDGNEAYIDWSELVPCRLDGTINA